MIIFKSVVSKLWVSVVILLIVILSLLGFLLGTFFENFYLDLEAKSMIKQGQVLVKAIESNGPDTLGNVQEMAQAFAQEKGSTILITDPNGMVRACSNMMAMPQKFRLAPQELASLQDGKVIVRKGKNPYSEVKTLSVVIPIVKKNKTELAVFLYAPLEPITATAKQVKMLILFMALGSVALASFLAYVLSRTLSRPLLEINRVASAMIKGEYEGNVVVRSEDEVGRLAKTFNILAAELREQEKIRKDFVANVSHELRTPLFLIQGYSEALLKDVAENKQKREESAKVILEETGRMQRLVNDLLDLAHVDSGKLKLNLEPLSLSSLVQRVTQKFLTLAREMDIILDCKIPDFFPLVLGDEDRLQQVFINLLDNAFRFTGAGDKITISLEQNSDCAVIKVTDTGKGIPAEEIPYIFERFYKVEKSRSRSEKGTGLGLAITKAILEAHHSTVNIKSEIDKGTEFQFTLAYI